MPIENDVIVNELKTQGIDEKLGKGLSFETDADLSEWVESYKSVLPTPNKKIEDYTKEEIEELAKDPQFKGAKGLQGYFDSIRQKPIPPVKPDLKKVEPKDEKPLWAIELEEKITKQQTILDENKAKDEAAKNKIAAINSIKSFKIEKDYDINTVLANVGSDFSDANIKKHSEAHIAHLTALGIKHIPGVSNSANDGQLKDATKKFAEKRRKLNKQKTT